MKELSIEEKAKAYDVAIKKAKSKIKDDKDHVLYEDDIIDLFPELAESESEDEKIRKDILAYLKGEFGNGKKQLTPYTHEISKWFTWLEKRGEQKPAAWKPSDKQMTALRRMKAAVGGEGEIYEPLNSLYEDLKKLREE